MMISSFIYLILKDLSLTIIIDRIAIGLDSFPLVAIPFFILAGRIMNLGGITNRIFDFCLTVYGHRKGGLAYVNVIASMIFAGISGSSVADVAGLGSIEIKAMTEDGYDPGYSAAVCAASSTIGPIVPPSIIMIVIGVLTGVSIGKLFAAGFIPGIMMGFSLMALVFYHARTGKVKFPPPRKRANINEIIAVTKSGFFALLSPVIILGGILTGVVTPTEAGVIAVLYSVIIGFVYGELKIKDIYSVLREAALASGVVMFFIAAAQIFAWIITTERIAVIAYEFISKITMHKWPILALINLGLFFMGCFLEGIAIVIITAPVLLPVMSLLKVDPVHFGVFMSVNVMLGLLTPPVGFSVFIASDLAKIPVSEGFKKTFPFIIPLFVTLILVTYIPELVLFLPRLIFE
jgi:tripartite ATP-independent transporter DctM subunit